MNKKYSIHEKTWLYPGKAGWVFVTIPSAIAREIDYFFAHQKRGWGSLPVAVTIGKTTWKTSIFPDKKSGSYLLPLKAAIRQKENVQPEQEISFEMEIAA